MSAPIEFRAAHEGDERILYEMIRELAVYEGKDAATLPLNETNLRQYVFGSQPLCQVEFAICNGTVVGYALYFYTFSASQGLPVLYLEDLYVKPECRRRGIGSGLLERLAVYAKQNNCCRMEWHVLNWNEAAIAFYQSLGGVLRKDLIQVRLGKNSFETKTGLTCEHDLQMASP